MTPFFFGPISDAIGGYYWAGGKLELGVPIALVGWWAHWGKCDWDSKRSQIWTENWKDCESRNSQMLEIQDQEEMVK
ncbi:unnamed protein product [Caretta caretta]